MNVSISHIFGSIYGCFTVSGTCIFQGEFGECENFKNDKPAIKFKGWFKI